MSKDAIEEYGHVEVVSVDMDETLPVDADALVERASKTVENMIPGDKKAAKKAVIERVREHVTKRLNQEGMPVPLPPYDVVLTDDRYWPLLEDCLLVVERYRLQGFDANRGTINDDLMRLQGNLTHLAGVVGYLRGSAEHATSARKLQKAKAYLLAKTARTDLNVTVTDTDATELARAQVEEFDNSRQNLVLISNMITNAYYAVRSFTDMLSNVAQRTSAQDRRSAPYST